MCISGGGVGMEAAGRAVPLAADRPLRRVRPRITEWKACVASAAEATGFPPGRVLSVIQRNDE